MSKRLKQRVCIDGRIHWISGYSQKELLENAVKLATEQCMDASTLTDKQPCIFSAYAENWMRLYKENHLKHTTLREYSTILNKHLLPAFGDADIRAVTTDAIQRFMNGKAAMSRKSIREMVMVLGMIMESAVEDGILTRNPARSKRLTNPSQRVKQRNALTSVQLNDIVLQLPKHSNAQERFFLALLIYTGMRRSEVLGLRWGDVDLLRGIIDVRRGVTYKGNLPQISTPKTAAGIRQIPIPDALRQWLCPGDKNCYVIGGQESPVTEKSFQCMWRRIASSIDLHGATPHVFRHTYMTFAQRAKVATKTLQSIGGYADLATLQDRYIHTQQEDIEAARLAIEGMFPPLLWQQCGSTETRNPL